MDTLLNQLKERDPELYQNIVSDLLSPGDHRNNFIICGKLQERIRARGWSYRLIWASSVDICKAFICTGPGIHDSVNCDTEAEALLGAYLAAIP